MQFGSWQDIYSSGTYGAGALGSNWIDSGYSTVYLTGGANGGERWALGGVGYHFFDILSSQTLTMSGYLYHQYDIFFGYQTSDGSVIPASTVIGSYTQFGSSLSIASRGTSFGGYGLATPGEDWVDVAGTVGYQSYDTGAGERWALSTGTTSYSVSSYSPYSSIYELGYYHQYQITFGYSVVNTGVIDNSLVVGHYWQFGSSNDITSDGSGGVSPSSATWVDAGAGNVNYVTAVASSTTERWAVASSPDSMTVSSTGTLSESGYYHQFQVGFGYGTSAPEQ